ncbi:MAG TPA: OmpA family protein [Rhodopila sp.]|nr:OmpA family protein [Rhodopila sp.]
MCNRHRPSRVGRIVLAASGITLTGIALTGIASPLGGAAMAQSVRVFDEAPPLDLLRSIMIPESKPGLSRTIIIQRPDGIAPNSGVQRSAVTVTQVAPERTHATFQAAASDAEPEAAPASQPMPAQPAPPPAPAVKRGTVGLRINFAFNSAELPESAFAMIDRVVEVMKEAPDVKVRVEGHTDAVGAAAYNMSLSERRALSVAQYLVKQGIDPSRLMLVGMGMTEPLTDNPYDPANRRVQFVRVG